MQKEIVIKINDEGMSYESDLSIEEIVFWLEACKQGILSYTFATNEAKLVEA